MKGTTSPSQRLLEHLAHEARVKFKLHVWQWLPGHVGSHANGSYHGQTYPGSDVGRAFDAYRSALQQARYARWLRRHYKAALTECIYNGRYTKVSIKHGKDVPYSYWGSAVWTEHQNHVHVAI